MAEIGSNSVVPVSFDHLVGAGEQRRRDVEAEHLGGRNIDHEFELGRLHDRQIGGLSARDAARLLDFISARKTPVCLPLGAGIVQVT